MLALDTAWVGAQKAHVLACSRRAQARDLLRRCSGSYVSRDGRIGPGVLPVHAAIVMHVLQALQDLVGNGGDELFWHAVLESACHASHQCIYPEECSHKCIEMESLSQHNVAYADKFHSTL